MPVYKFSSGFLTKSRDAAEFLVQFGAKPEKMHVVHVGFNDSQFKSVRADLLNEITGFSKDRKILVSVGLLIARKNHATMIKAIEKFRIKNSEIALAIFGDGSEKKSLLKMIRDVSKRNIFF